MVEAVIVNYAYFLFAFFDCLKCKHQTLPEFTYFQFEGSDIAWLCLKITEKRVEVFFFCRYRGNRLLMR